MHPSGLIPVLLTSNFSQCRMISLNTCKYQRNILTILSLKPKSILQDEAILDACQIFSEESTH